jgi:DNA-binding NtrC family response regulator
MDQARILIVDDDVSFLARLKARLEAYGFAVNTAADGRGALERTSETEFDAVVLDVQMPGMDGETALAELLKRNVDLNVIMLTGYASIDKGVDAMKTGAFDYLEKPANMTQLVERLRAARQKRLLLLEKDKENKLRDILKSKSW